MGPLPRNSPKHSFGLRCPELRPSATPGPGQYHGPPHSARSSRSRQAVFGTSTRDGFSSLGPGPGAYTSEDLSRGMRCEKPAITCAPKLKMPGTSFKGDNVPGPGAYFEGNGSLILDAPKFSVGTAPRMVHSKVSYPGPAHYGGSQNPCRKVKPGCAFGTAGRMLERTVVTPGPGSYSLSSTLAGASYSMSERFSRRDVMTDGPGPGGFMGPSDFGESCYWQQASRITASILRSSTPRANMTSTYSQSFEERQILPSEEGQIDQAAMSQGGDDELSDAM